MKKLNINLAKLSALFSLMVFLFMPTAAQAQFSGTNGRIISYGIGYGAVSVKPDGSNYFGHNISFVNSGSLQRQFVYSPDGAQIAYSKLNGTDVHLYIKSSSSYADDGVQLTTDTGVIDGNPYFSSDGTKIAFNRTNIATAKTDVYVIGVDGSGITRLTQAMYGASGQVLNPVWSNDDTKIFVSTSDAGANGIGIYSISPTTPNQSTATSIVTAAEMTGESLGMYFDISPDNATFAYNSNSGDDSTNFSIRKVAYDGTGDSVVVNSNNTARWTLGTFSPDGTKIVATKSNTLSTITYDLYTMNVDGTSQTAISVGNGNSTSSTGPFEFSPGYSPFWGTNQDTYPNNGSFGGFDSVGAPNTTTTNYLSKNYFPVVITSLATLGFIALLGIYLRKEFYGRKR
jgi:hypothetical protein